MKKGKAALKRGMDHVKIGGWVGVDLMAVP